MSGIIEKIEKQYPVETIKAQQMQIWPYLRIYIGSKAVSNLGTILLNKSIFNSFVKNLFHGFTNIFRKFEYIGFSDSKERRRMGKMYADKSMDYIIEILPKTLLFELPLPTHYSANTIPTPFLTSKYIFYLLEHIYILLFLQKIKIENEHVISTILKDHAVDVNYKSIIKKHLAQYHVMRWFLKFQSPKAVFIECYYTNLGRIKAIKEKGIKVIEIQHGVINRSHFAYNIHTPLDSKFFPDYLLTFGLREKDIFINTNYFIDPNHVIPIGHLYIDYLYENYQGSDSFLQMKSKYKFTVTISGQNHYTELKLIEFLIQAALIDKNILFVFAPRDHTFNIDAYKFPKNLVIVNELNCYEQISMSDFHSTIFSTCALEAPSLGVQNILINIENLSDLHYSAVLNKDNITRYVSTPQEYVNTINSFPKLNKNEIRESNNSIIVPDYKNNIKKALNKILG